MAVLINDLFDFFWLYTVPGNVFDIVVVPLRLQLPESHRLKLPQKTASFDSSNAKAEPTGVHTAIVGTTKPERIQENAAILEAGPLPKDLFEKIRSRWHEVADSSWVGET